MQRRCEDNEVHQEVTTSRILCWYSDRLHNTASAGCSIFVTNNNTTSAGSSIMQPIRIRPGSRLGEVDLSRLGPLKSSQVRFICRRRRIPQAQSVLGQVDLKKIGH